MKPTPEGTEHARWQVAAAKARLRREHYRRNEFKAYPPEMRMVLERAESGIEWSNDDLAVLHREQAYTYHHRDRSFWKLLAKVMAFQDDPKHGELLSILLKHWSDPVDGMPALYPLGPKEACAAMEKHLGKDYDPNTYKVTLWRLRKKFRKRLNIRKRR